MKSLRMSRRSDDEMSQCRCSFISVNSQGFSRAPLQECQPGLAWSQGNPGSSIPSVHLGHLKTQDFVWCFEPGCHCVAKAGQILLSLPPSAGVMDRCHHIWHGPGFPTQPTALPSLDLWLWKCPTPLPPPYQLHGASWGSQAGLQPPRRPWGIYRPIMIPETPVCMARLASSYDKMSPFPEGTETGSQERDNSTAPTSCGGSGLG